MLLLDGCSIKIKIIFLLITFLLIEIAIQNHQRAIENPFWARNGTWFRTRMELSTHLSNWVQEPIILCCFLILLVIFRNLSFVILDPLQVIKTYLLPLLQEEEDFVKKYGKWAVVTGCTQGIGRSYVDELAKRGMNLVLISRDRIKLSELEEYLKRKHEGN